MCAFKPRRHKSVHNCKLCVCYLLVVTTPKTMLGGWTWHYHSCCFMFIHESHPGRWLTWWWWQLASLWQRVHMCCLRAVSHIRWSRCLWCNIIYMETWELWGWRTQKLPECRCRLPECLKDSLSTVTCKCFWALVVTNFSYCELLSCLDMTWSTRV